MKLQENMRYLKTVLYKEKKRLSQRKQNVNVIFQKDENIF
jgi:hypothetical protein